MPNPTTTDPTPHLGPSDRKSRDFSGSGKKRGCNRRESRDFGALRDWKGEDLRALILCGGPFSHSCARLQVPHCRATRVAADFQDFRAFCWCSTGVALHPLRILVSHLPPPLSLEVSHRNLGLKRCRATRGCRSYSCGCRATLCNSAFSFTLGEEPPHDDFFGGILAGDFSESFFVCCLALEQRIAQGPGARDAPRLLSSQTLCVKLWATAAARSKKIKEKKNCKLSKCKCFWLFDLEYVREFT